MSSNISFDIEFTKFILVKIFSKLVFPASKPFIFISKSFDIDI